MRRILPIALAAAAVFLVTAGVTAAAGPPSGWSWLIGQLGGSSLGRQTGASALYVGPYWGGPSSVELSARAVTVSSGYGNFEFEHGYGEPNSSLLARTTSGSQTPLAIGLADGQDLTPLIVSGELAMSPDLQTWNLGGLTVVAIDPNGELRLNGIVLETVVDESGKATLEAELPDGSTQLLVPVARVTKGRG